jgi:eukaryotic-like serine/threonine-protein kinase
MFVDPTRADRNLLVGMLALQLNFVTREQLLAAAIAWTRDKSRPLVDLLADQQALTAAERETLSGLVDLHLARHHNDPHQSLASLAPGEAAHELLGAIDDDELQQSLAIWPAASPAAGADPFVTTAPDARDPFSTTPPDADDPFSTAAPVAADPFSTTAPASPAAGDRASSAASGKAPRTLLSGDSDDWPAGKPGRNPPASSLPSPPTALATVEYSERSGADHARAAAGSGPLSTPAAQRYAILKAFQRGGLGQVSVARDRELNRDVALKEILPRHADSEEARQRFLIEAEITGSLEHPGIVPVYGLGQYADGRPFYAMRFIRGDNLQLAIDEFHAHARAADRELRFRQLLGRFVDVCNAMEYAHNRCVLHRDLKPGNIMLGKYGETLVVDWGLAKTIGADVHPTDTVELPVRPLSADSTTATQMGRVVGTPAYMSPEQASGRLDLLGPATDIYSLGATLYQILTGVPPFGVDDRHDLLGKVQRGEFKPPRQRKADIPRTLEAICLKAMANEPRERYLSSQALAEDVERYLADEPVHAYTEPLPLRAARWMRKHRALVYSAAAVLVVTAVALTLGVVLLGAANRREQAQRQLAERNFELARNAVRDYYISVSEDTLLNQEGMQPLRDQLLRQALAYYQTFLETEPEEAPLRDELAQANFFVGSITEKIDSPDEAIPFYEQARDLYRVLAAEQPASPAPREGLGRTLNAIGGSLQKLQRFEESLAYYAQAQQVRQQLVDDEPDNIEFLRTLANTVMNQGTIAVMQGDDDRGVELWNQAQALRLARLAPGDAAHKLLLRDVGLGNFNLGLFQLELDHFDEAETRLLDAVEVFEQVVDGSPNDLDSQYRLALAYRTLGDIQPTDDGMDRAVAYYDRAFELLRGLSLRNPEVPNYKANLGSMQLMVADLKLAFGQQAAALDAIDRAIEPLQQLVEQFPDIVLYRRDLAVARRIRGGILTQAAATPEQHAEAVRELTLASDELEQLARQTPADEDFQAQRDIAAETLEQAKTRVAEPRESSPEAPPEPEPADGPAAVPAEGPAEGPAATPAETTSRVDTESERGVGSSPSTRKRTSAFGLAVV